MIGFVKEKFVDLVVETCHKLHVERFNLKHDDEQLLLKKDAIKKLAKRGVLDFPTQGMLAEWYNVHLSDFESLIHHGRWMSIKYTWETMPETVHQQCHAVSAYYWSLNPETTLYTGFSDHLHAHSWILKPNKVLLEPTPILRDVYFGYIHPEPEEFVKDEVDNILRLMDRAELPNTHRSHFEDIRDTL